MKTLAMHTNGRFEEDLEGALFTDALNPATEAVITREPQGTAADADRAVMETASQNITN